MPSLEQNLCGVCRMKVAIPVVQLVTLALIAFTAFGQSENTRSVFSEVIERRKAQVRSLSVRILPEKTTIASEEKIMTMDSIKLEIYRSLYNSVAEEMGVSLRRTAFYANIKETRDCSCAVFDRRGRLIAQGDHMPVHLGSMPMSVRAAIEHCEMGPGDVVILNDPYAGGTHLPDVTVVAPVFAAGRRQGDKGTRGQGDQGTSAPRGLHRHVSPSDHLTHTLSPPPLVSPSPSLPLFFVANRAHQADIGGATPGSMGSATEIYQ